MAVWKVGEAAPSPGVVPYGGTHDESEGNLLTDTARDLGVGLVDVGGAIAGIGDFVASPLRKPGEGTFTQAWDESAAGQWKRDLQEGYSPERKAAEAEYENYMAQGDGSQLDQFGRAVFGMITNPRVGFGRVAQSAPSMLAGGGVGGATAKMAIARKASENGVKWAGRIGSGAGEGLISGGLAAGQIAEHNRENGYEPTRGMGAPVATALGVGAIGTLGGGMEAGLFNRTVRSANGASEGIVKTAIKEGGKEGLEEMSQSPVENIPTNLATDQPWNEGLGRDMGEGAVAGFGMGASLGPLSHSRKTEVMGNDEPSRATWDRSKPPVEAPSVDPAVVAEDTGVTMTGNPTKDAEAYINANTEEEGEGGEGEGGKAPTGEAPTTGAQPLQIDKKSGAKLWEGVQSRARTLTNEEVKRTNALLQHPVGEPLIKAAVEANSQVGARFSVSKLLNLMDYALEGTESVEQAVAKLRELAKAEETTNGGLNASDVYAVAAEVLAGNENAAQFLQERRDERALAQIKGKLQVERDKSVKKASEAKEKEAKASEAEGGETEPGLKGTAADAFKAYKAKKDGATAEPPKQNPSNPDVIEGEYTIKGEEKPAEPTVAREPAPQEPVHQEAAPAEPTTAVAPAEENPSAANPAKTTKSTSKGGKKAAKAEPVDIDKPAPWHQEKKPPVDFGPYNATPKINHIQPGKSAGKSADVPPAVVKTEETEPSKEGGKKTAKKAFTPKVDQVPAETPETPSNAIKPKDQPEGSTNPEPESPKAEEKPESKPLEEIAEAAFAHYKKRRAELEGEGNQHSYEAAIDEVLENSPNKEMSMTALVGIAARAKHMGSRAGAIATLRVIKAKAKNMPEHDKKRVMDVVEGVAKGLHLSEIERASMDGKVSIPEKKTGTTRPFAGLAGLMGKKDEETPKPAEAPKPTAAVPNAAAGETNTMVKKPEDDGPKPPSGGKSVAKPTSKTKGEVVTKTDAKEHGRAVAAGKAKWSPNKGKNVPANKTGKHVAKSPAEMRPESEFAKAPLWVRQTREFAVAWYEARGGWPTQEEYRDEIWPQLAKDNNWLPADMIDRLTGNAWTFKYFGDITRGSLEEPNRGSKETKRGAKEDRKAVAKKMSDDMTKEWVEHKKRLQAKKDAGQTLKPFEQAVLDYDKPSEADVRAYATRELMRGNVSTRIYVKDFAPESFEKMENERTDRGGANYDKATKKTASVFKHDYVYDNSSESGGKGTLVESKKPSSMVVAEEGGVSQFTNEQKAAVELKQLESLPTREQQVEAITNALNHLGDLPAESGGSTRTSVTMAAIMATQRAAQRSAHSKERWTKEQFADVIRAISDVLNGNRNLFAAAQLAELNMLKEQILANSQLESWRALEAAMSGADSKKANEYKELSGGVLIDDPGAKSRLIPTDEPAPTEKGAGDEGPNAQTSGWEDAPTEGGGAINTESGRVGHFMVEGKNGLKAQLARHMKEDLGWTEDLKFDENADMIRAKVEEDSEAAQTLQDWFAAQAETIGPKLTKMRYEDVLALYLDLCDMSDSIGVGSNALVELVQAESVARAAKAAVISEKEKEKRDAAIKAKKEKEAAEKARAEKEAAEKAKAEKEAAEKTKAEKEATEKALKEKLAAEVAEKEATEKTERLHGDKRFTLESVVDGADGPYGESGAKTVEELMGTVKPQTPAGAKLAKELSYLFVQDKTLEEEKALSKEEKDKKSITRVAGRMLPLASIVSTAQSEADLQGLLCPSYAHGLWSAITELKKLGFKDFSGIYVVDQAHDDQNTVFVNAASNPVSGVRVGRGCCLTTPVGLCMYVRTGENKWMRGEVRKGVSLVQAIYGRESNLFNSGDGRLMDDEFLRTLLLHELIHALDAQSDRRLTGALMERVGKKTKAFEELRSLRFASRHIYDGWAPWLTEKLKKASAELQEKYNLSDGETSKAVSVAPKVIYPFTYEYHSDETKLYKELLAEAVAGYTTSEAYRSTIAKLAPHFYKELKEFIENDVILRNANDTDSTNDNSGGLGIKDPSTPRGFARIGDRSARTDGREGGLSVRNRNGDGNSRGQRDGQYESADDHNRDSAHSDAVPTRRAVVHGGDVRASDVSEVNAARRRSEQAVTGHAGPDTSARNENLGRNVVQGGSGRAVGVRRSPERSTEGSYSGNAQGVGNPSSAEAQARQHLQNRGPAGLRGSFRDLLLNTVDAAKTKIGLGLLFTRDLVNMAAKAAPDVPAFKQWHGLMERQAAYRNDWQARVATINEHFEALPKAVQQRVNKFLENVTLEGVWPFRDPDVFAKESDWEAYKSKLKDADKVKFDRAVREYQALPLAAQSVVYSVLHHGVESRRTRANLMRDFVEERYNGLIDKAADKFSKEKWEKEKADWLKRCDTLAAQVNSPYVPLRRFGSHVVVRQSKTYDYTKRLAGEVYRRIQATTNGRPTKAQMAPFHKLQKKLAEMQGDPRHYEVQFVEGAGTADRHAKTLQRQYPDAIVESFARAEHTEGSVPSWQKLEQVITSAQQNLEIEKLSVDPETNDRTAASLAEIMNAAQRMYVEALSDDHARKSELRRMRVAGYHTNMMENFMETGRAEANLYANMSYGSKVRKVLVDMQQEVRHSSNRQGAADYQNEMLKRHNQMLRGEQTSQAVNTLLRTNSVVMLMTSPAYYLQNLLQPMMMSAPYMAGHHGMMAATVAINKTMAQAASALRKGTSLDEIALGMRLTKQETEALRRARDLGHIDIGMSSDFGHVTRSDAGKVKKAFAQVTDKLTEVSRRVEMVNRIGTFIAAYRLENERLRGKNPEAAWQYADEVVYKTHGDYSGINAPRLFGMNSLTKVGTQFRKFQLIQAGMMIGLAARAFKDASPAEKAVARRQLAWTLGVHFAMAGAKGTPFLATILVALGALFGAGGDDEDDWIRTLVGDKQTSDFLLNGIPKALGVDMSGKVGAGNMLSPFPFLETKPSEGEDFWKDMVVAALGPTGSLGERVMRGYSYASQGDWSKGAEAIAPTGISNLLKAFRFSTEGVTTKAGDVQIPGEDYTFFDAVMQTAGLPTNKTTDRTRHMGSLIRHEEYFEGKQKQLVHDYKEAWKAKDSKAMMQLRRQFIELNKERRAQGFQPVKMSSMTKAPIQQRKREYQGQAVGSSVGVKRSNRLFVEDMMKK